MYSVYTYKNPGDLYCEYFIALIHRPRGFRYDALDFHSEKWHWFDSHHKHFRKLSEESFFNGRSANIGFCYKGEYLHPIGMSMRS